MIFSFCRKQRQVVFLSLSVAVGLSAGANNLVFAQLDPGIKVDSLENHPNDAQNAPTNISKTQSNKTNNSLNLGKTEGGLIPCIKPADFHGEGAQYRKAGAVSNERKAGESINFSKSEGGIVLCRGGGTQDRKAGESINFSKSEGGLTPCAMPGQAGMAPPERKAGESLNFSKSEGGFIPCIKPADFQGQGAHERKAGESINFSKSEGGIVLCRGGGTQDRKAGESINFSKSEGGLTPCAMPGQAGMAPPERKAGESLNFSKSEGGFIPCIKPANFQGQGAHERKVGESINFSKSEGGIVLCRGGGTQDRKAGESINFSKSEGGIILCRAGGTQDRKAGESINFSKSEGGLVPCLMPGQNKGTQERKAGESLNLGTSESGVIPCVKPAGHEEGGHDRKAGESLNFSKSEGGLIPCLKPGQNKSNGELLQSTSQAGSQNSAQVDFRKAGEAAESEHGLIGLLRNGKGQSKANGELLPAVDQGGAHDRKAGGQENSALVDFKTGTNGVKIDGPHDRKAGGSEAIQINEANGELLPAVSQPGSTHEAMDIPLDNGQVSTTGSGAPEGPLGPPHVTIIPLPSHPNTGSSQPVGQHGLLQVNPNLMMQTGQGNAQHAQGITLTPTNVHVTTGGTSFNPAALGKFEAGRQVAPSNVSTVGTHGVSSAGAHNLRETHNVLTKTK